MKISAVIITLNEEKNLPKCLESLNWVDEIIIVDSNSFDNTVSIGRLAGAKVYEREHWTGFGDQKNKAIKYATGDWIFSIDADERATPELAHEIKEVISSGLTVSGLMMPRSMLKEGSGRVAWMILKKSHRVGFIVSIRI